MEACKRDGGMALSLGSRRVAADLRQHLLCQSRDPPETALQQCGGFGRRLRAFISHADFTHEQLAARGSIVSTAQMLGRKDAAPQSNCILIRQKKVFGESV